MRMDAIQKFDKPEFVKENAILVTGGSGFIGRRLTARLAEQNQAVVCMYHQRLPDPMANVYPVCSDMSSSELIAAPLRGVETVVHLAWENNFVGPTEKFSWNISGEQLPRNIKVLRNLIAAMEKAKTRRIIFLSAIGASRKTTIPFLQEKYLAEFFILNSSIPEKVILRSSLVCANGGANDRFLNSIARVMQFPGVYPVPSSKQEIAPIHVDDIAKYLSRIATMDMPTGNSSVVELVGREQLKIEEIFKIVSGRLGKSGKIPLKGFLGDSLTPWFEREKNQTQAKLRHFLNIGSAVDQKTISDNPFANLKNDHFKSIREALGHMSHHPQSV
jgi:nucleoside-diphosphate-sugar epimerase